VKTVGNWGGADPAAEPVEDDLLSTEYLALALRVRDLGATLFPHDSIGPKTPKAASVSPIYPP